LVRDLEPQSLHRATLAVAGWCVRDQAGEIFHWNPGLQAFPLSPRLTAHFHSPAYAAAVTTALQGHRFRIDTDALAAICAEVGV
jgi:hypothetical protein